MNAKFFSLNMSDALKGLIVTVITTLLTSLLSVINRGGFPTTTDWKVIGFAALSAGMSYLIKNMLTNSNDEFLKVEPKVEEPGLKNLSKSI